MIQTTRMFLIAVKTGIALGWLLSQCRGEEPGIGPDGQYAAFAAPVTQKPVVAEPPKPAVTEKPSTSAKTQSVQGHSHRCPYDGTTWVHTAAMFGSEQAHKCPLCGRVQWNVHDEHVSIKARIAPVPLTRITGAPPIQSNCPGGVCPTQGKVVFRWFR